MAEPAPKQPAPPREPDPSVPTSPPAPSESAPATAGGAPPADTVPGALMAAAVKLIGYLATGAGFVTFVGVTGAAITWVRLRQADIPATEALQLIGIRNLVAEGAVALGIFAILGLVAVAVVYAIDSPGRATDEARHGLLAIAGIETVIAIWLAHDHGDMSLTGAAIATGVVVVLGALGACFSLLPADPGTSQTAPAEDAANPPSPRSESEWLGFRKSFGMRIATFRDVPPTDAELEEYKKRRTLFQDLGLDPGLPPKTRRRRQLRFSAIVISGLVALAEGVFFIVAYRDWVGWSVWVSTILAAVCFGVARASGDRFWPYGLAVFCSVALFGAWVTIVRLANDPELNPAALLRTGSSGVDGVVGFYIARTDDRYWLAAVTMTCKPKDKKDKTQVLDKVVSGSGRIFSIPRSQVIDEEIGARTSLKAAGGRTLDLLNELVHRQPPGGSPAPAPAPATTPTPPSGATTTPGAATTPGAGARRAPATVPEDLSPDSPAAVPSTMAITAPCFPAPPRLIRLDPATAAPGKRVEIIGRNLGVSGTVTLNGAKLKATRWHDQSVVVLVPKSKAHSGRVTLKRGERLSNSLVLKVGKRNARPVAAFSVTRIPGKPRTFKLDASASHDPERGSLKYRWRAAGRQFGRTRRVRFRLSPGRKTARVKLVVIDNRGQRGATERRVRVRSE